MASSQAGEQEDSGSQVSVFDHVAVCVDHSEAADDAVDLGRALASPDGRITLVHATEVTSQLGWVKMIAIPDLDWVPIGTELLDQLSEKVPEAETALLRGHPSVSVVQWVEQEHPDVVICAAHDGLMARTLLGSVSSYLAYHLPCPVAIARPGTARPKRFAHVAACVDVDDHSTRVLDLADRLASAHLARLSAVHVTDDLHAYGQVGWTPDLQAWQREWEAMLAELVGERQCAQVVLEGNYAGPVVNEWAEKEGVDLLVAAAHRGGLQRWFLGGFASHLAHNAPCDLLISR